MRRPVLISSLTAGRCFTLAKPDPAPDEDAKAARFQTGRSILQADMVWKVVGPDDDGVAAESALGAIDHHAPNTLVVEVPRQGFDRLAERARELAES